jgi:hypothetical protein
MHRGRQTCVRNATSRMKEKINTWENKITAGIIDWRAEILRNSVYDLHPHDKVLRLHYTLIT